MGSPPGERTSEGDPDGPELQAGQSVKVEGVMTPMKIKRADDRFVAVGPQGGLYELVETADGLRARSGTSTRHAEIIAAEGQSASTDR